MPEIDSLSASPSPFTKCLKRSHFSALSSIADGRKLFSSRCMQMHLLLTLDSKVGEAEEKSFHIMLVRLSFFNQVMQAFVIPDGATSWIE